MRLLLSSQTTSYYPSRSYRYILVQTVVVLLVAINRVQYDCCLQLLPVVSASASETIPATNHNNNNNDNNNNNKRSGFLFHFPTLFNTTKTVADEEEEEEEIPKAAEEEPKQEQEPPKKRRSKESSNKDDKNDDNDDDEDEDSELPERKKGLFWSRKETQVEEGEEESKQNSTKPEKKRFFFARKDKIDEKKNEEKSKDDTTNEDSEGNKDQEKNTDESSSADVNSSSSSSSDPPLEEPKSDQQSSDTQQSYNQSTTMDTQPQQSVAPNVIVVGPVHDGSPRYYRRQQQPSPNQQQQQQHPLPPRHLYGTGPPGSLTPQQLQQLQQQQQQQRQMQQQMQQNSIIIVEVVASIIGTAMRLWFLTWITKFLASQEQVIAPTQHFVWERMNDRYSKDTTALKTVIDTPPSHMTIGQWKRHSKKFQAKSTPKNITSTAASDLAGTTFRRTVVVVELSSDSKGNFDLDFMSDMITFLIQQQSNHAFGTSKENPNQPLELEVVLLVQSPGGSVATYGLAAAQLQRLRSSCCPQTQITVCVDKYAASGGYMIASQADRLIAAPFATVGSVGVIMEGLNFHEIAKRYGIQPLVLKAGTSKNPITTWGPVSKLEIQSETKRLDKVHTAFRDLVLEGRPSLKSVKNYNDLLLDGSVYLGREAVDLNLVDAVMTSDEYVFQRIQAGDRVLKLHRLDQDRYHRSIRGLSPLDILPHLLFLPRRMRNHWTKISQFVQSTFQLDVDVNAAAAQDESLGDLLSSFVTRLVQLGTYAGFIKYMIQQHIKT